MAEPLAAHAKFRTRRADEAQCEAARVLSAHELRIRRDAPLDARSERGRVRASRALLDGLRRRRRGPRPGARRLRGGQHPDRRLDAAWRIAGRSSSPIRAPRPSFTRGRPAHALRGRPAPAHRAHRRARARRAPLVARPRVADRDAAVRDGHGHDRTRGRGRGCRRTAAGPPRAPSGGRAARGGGPRGRDAPHGAAARTTRRALRRADCRARAGDRTHGASCARVHRRSARARRDAAGDRRRGRRRHPLAAGGVPHAARRVALGLRAARAPRPAAHAALRDADPGDGTTVTEVALRFGFAHTGRFAAAYRRRYGQTPSATLRR